MMLMAIFGVLSCAMVYGASVDIGAQPLSPADRQKENVLVQPETSSAEKSRCQCVPDQWQGVLFSTDREYDLNGGQTSSSENRLMIHYDFKNKKFAMTDINTGSRAIADYKKGFKYVVRGPFCHGLQTGETMKQMCLPEGADFLGRYKLGSSVPVDMWEFHGPFNTSMKTAVLHDDCVPVSEEIYMYRGGYVSVTSSLYVDVQIDAVDNDVFAPPADCMMQNYGHPGMRGQQKKRSDADRFDDFLSALRQRLYIFN